MPVLGLDCCTRASSSCGERGLLSSCGGSFSCGAWAPGTRASVVAVWGLSCSVTCGVFPGQGSKLCMLIGRQTLNHWTTREVLNDLFQVLEMAVEFSPTSLWYPSSPCPPSRCCPRSVSWLYFLSPFPAWERWSYNLFGYVIGGAYPGICGMHLYLHSMYNFPALCLVLSSRTRERWLMLHCWKFLALKTKIRLHAVMKDTATPWGPCTWIESQLHYLLSMWSWALCPLSSSGKYG